MRIRDFYSLPVYERGFTLIQAFRVIVTVVAALGVIATLYGFYVVFSVTTTGTWTSAPPTVPYLRSSTFTYNVTQSSTKFSTPRPLNGRLLEFEVSPYQEFTISANGVVSPNSGINAGKIRVSTGPLGDVTITLTHIEPEYEGGGVIIVTDVTSGEMDPPQSFSVQ